MAALCVTCNAKPAVRLYYGTVDGPYWCSFECKDRWLLPTPADANEPNGRDGTPVQGAALEDAYDTLMKRVG